MKGKIDYQLLEKCADLLIGEHNFSLLSKDNPEITNKNCIIFESFWEQHNHELIYTIKANRFLHHMVRFIVGTSIETAKTKLMAIKVIMDMAEKVDLLPTFLNI